MKNNFLSLLGVLLCLVSMSSARAEEVYESPWYLFLGLDVGYSNYSPYNDSLTETSRSGFDGGVRASLAHYWTDWVADGGFGYQLISNSGTNSDGSKNEDKSQVGFFSFSPRYRLGSQFQFGPEFQYWLSTDKGLNPTVGRTDTISDASNTSYWLGAQALVEWDKDQKYRLGVRGLHGMNVTGRTVNVFQVFVQMGFDLFGSGSEDRERAKRLEQVNSRDLETAQIQRKSEPLPMAVVPKESAPEPLNPDPVVLATPSEPEAEPLAEPMVTPSQEVAEELPVSPDLIAPHAAKNVVLTLDINDLPFGFDNANLPKTNAARVKNMGRYLAKNGKAWKRLVISGHTDERGANIYNLKLSKRRAEAVKSLLVAGGVPSKKVVSIGYGESKPKDRRHTESAWAKNRRVELDFKGVSDAQVIKKAMAQ